MTNESHRNLENQVEYLQFERDALIEDLENAGAITNSTRSLDYKNFYFQLSKNCF